jgi:hypothetical protein
MPLISTIMPYRSSAVLGTSIRVVASAGAAGELLLSWTKSDSQLLGGDVAEKARVAARVPIFDHLRTAVAANWRKGNKSRHLLHCRWGPRGAGMLG